jgi:hypothetical protein
MLLTAWRKDIRSPAKRTSALEWATADRHTGGMTNPVWPSFDASEQAILDEIGGRLRAWGWAAHVTVA